jgi:hypothetical protein
MSIPAAAIKLERLLVTIRVAASEVVQHFLQNTKDSTARYVAEEETAAWQDLLAGKKDIVEENTFYVGPDAALHAKLFGKMEIPTLYQDT